jgi:invasion protein IalB
LKRWALAVLLACATKLCAETHPAPQQFRDWQLVCQSQSAPCSVVQRIVAPRGALFLAEVQLTRSAAGVALVVATPLGPFLPERPVAQVSGRDPMVFDWHSCDRRRCLAVHRLEDTSLTALKRATRMTLGYRLAGSQEARRLEVSLMGLTAALRALDSRSP